MTIKLKANLIIQNLINKAILDIDSLSSTLKVTPESIRNYIKGENLSKETCDNLFNLLELLNIDLFNILDLEDDSYYYHMSSYGIKGIISSRYNSMNKYNDFGYGFYLSESFKVGATYIKKDDNPHLYCFKKDKFNTIKDNNKYYFKDNVIDTINWVMYIGLNRRKIDNERYQSILNKRFNTLFKHKKFIVGKIADSLNFEVMDEFFKNNYDMFQVKSQLTKANLGYQYVIKDEEFANSLTWDKEYIFDKRLIDLIIRWRALRNKKLRDDNQRSILHKDSINEYRFYNLMEKYIYE